MKKKTEQNAAGAPQTGKTAGAGAAGFLKKNWKWLVPVACVAVLGGVWLLKPKADKPAKVDARSTPVWVELEGTDSIGARLGMRLKEAFNGSNLFSLTDKDMPKMRLLVSTQSEFPGRPGVGSVYSICWTFTQGEGYLGYLLAREVGTLTYEEIDALVNRLVERTDGLSVKYSNLWK